MKRFAYLIIFLIGIAIVSGIIFLISINLGPKIGNLEDCITLKKDNDNGINIVFFAKEKKQAEKYMNYFLRLRPFDENVDNFNFFYINSYFPECELYNDIALLCYSRELVQKAGSCPNDQIVVLSDDFDRRIRSSTYLNVMSINTKHPLSVLAHEFGHSFVNLAEEYVPAKIPRNSAGNCVTNCKEFNGINEGCYEECSRNDYFRSIENGVMRTLQSEDYGKFNSWVINNKISSLSKENRISGSAISQLSDCPDSRYYLVEGNYQEKLNIIDREILQGCSGDSGAGAFSFDVVLDSDKRVKIGEFNPEMIFTDGLLEGDGKILASPAFEEIDGETFTSDRSFFLKVPAIEGAKRVEIIEPGLKVIISLPICEGNLIGDVNGDGKINIFDVDDIRYGLETGYFNCKDNADFNGNGIINLEDADELYDSLSEEQRARGESVVSVELTGKSILEKVNKWVSKIF